MLTISVLSLLTVTKSLSVAPPTFCVPCAMTPSAAVRQIRRKLTEDAKEKGPAGKFQEKAFFLNPRSIAGFIAL